MKKKGIITAAVTGLILISLAVSIRFASAYYSEKFETKENAAIATLSYRYPDEMKKEAEQGKEFGIRADLSDFDEKAGYWQTGDSVVLNFSAFLSGDTEAFVMPVFDLEADVLSSGNVIEIFLNDGNGEKKLGELNEKKLKTTMYGEVKAVPAQSEKTYQYRVLFKKIDNDNMPAIGFDFHLAAVQKKYNATPSSAASSYEAISARFQDDATSPVIGFADVCGLDQAVDQNGDADLQDSRKQYKISFRPQIEVGNPERYLCTWYMSENGTERKLKEQMDGAAINFLINKQSAEHRTYRYEVKNEAGIVCSVVYQFAVTDEGISFTTKPYMEDLSDRQ